jgi:hypothetical protein
MDCFTERYSILFPDHLSLSFTGEMFQAYRTPNLEKKYVRCIVVPWTQETWRSGTLTSNGKGGQKRGVHGPTFHLNIFLPPLKLQEK